MYEIYVGNNKLYNNENIDEIIIHFNKILSRYHDYNISLTVKIKNNDIIIYTNDNIITLKNNNGLNFTINKAYLLLFLILNKKIIANVDIKNIVKFNPYCILDIMTFTDCMINPYDILIHLFHINEELIYQTFILYLNKTVTINNKPNHLDINKIFNNFFQNNKYICSIDKYHKLFSFYLLNKKFRTFIEKSILRSKCISKYSEIGNTISW